MSEQMTGDEAADLFYEIALFAADEEREAAFEMDAGQLKTIQDFLKRVAEIQGCPWPNISDNSDMLIRREQALEQFYARRYGGAAA
jgi:hypothetical protein